MHTSALKTAKLFFENYCNKQNLHIVEIGSQDVNGSLRQHAPTQCNYVGVDFSKGKGVDVVLTDPYKFPFEDNTFDVLMTSSCLEHSAMFWLSFLEGIRILKPNGLLYCNVPSNGMEYHKYPIDCWRFFPDAAIGLESWAKYNGYNTTVLETYVTRPTFINQDDYVSDWVGIFLKDSNYSNLHTNRIKHLDSIYLAGLV
jgi:hypothetical protein